MTKDPGNNFSMQSIIDMARGSGGSSHKAPVMKPIVDPVGAAAADTAVDRRAALATAKFHAEREISQMKEMINKLREDSKDMVLFSDNMAILTEALLLGYVEGFIEPIIRGENLVNCPENEFNSIRIGVFNALINRYVTKAN
jgi:folate-dependent phosphoribosylglycinamide formyltransferase PurN